MARMIMKVFLYVVVACMVVSAPYVDAAITCGQVVTNMLPCLAYLRNGGAVPLPCCNGVKNLNAAAQTTPDRQNACVCLKNAYTSYPGINANYAISLPGKCGVKIPYKFSPTTDCSKVQ